MLLAIAIPLQLLATPPVPGIALQLASRTQVDYELRFEPGDETGFPLRRRPTWHLTVSGSGLDPDAGAVALVFNGWGNWEEVDSLYIDVQRCSPERDADLFPGNALVLHEPKDWGGSFEVEFAIHPLRVGSMVQKRLGLLPTWSPGFSFGQSRNVFPQVYQDGGPIGGERRVRLRAPRSCPISSGWAGLTTGSQDLQLDPTHGNAFLGFGEPLAHARRELGTRRLEVVQYGQTLNVVEPVADLALRLTSSIEQALGPLSDPVVVFITDVGGGGMGADFGLVLGYEADTPDWQIESPYYQHFVAHEFFHQWLGCRLRGSESFTWFHEGFTEYLSLWHLASARVISREWFAERLLELGAEARERSSWGRRAFADPEVNWRDGDGPNETMAYKGGAMLAFLLDVSLRENGKPGLLKLLRDLMDRGVEDASLEDLRAWCEDQGLDDFWQRYVAGTEVPDLGTWLERIGYVKQGEGPKVRYEAGDPGLDAFFRFDS